MTNEFWRKKRERDLFSEHADYNSNWDLSDDSSPTFLHEWNISVANGSRFSWNLRDSVCYQFAHQIQLRLRSGKNNTTWWHVCFWAFFRPPEITRLPLWPGCYEIWYPTESCAAVRRHGIEGISNKNVPRMAPIRTVRLSISASSFSLSLSFFFSDVLHTKLLCHPIELKLVAKQFTAPADISFSFDTTVNSVHSSAL